MGEVSQFMDIIRSKKSALHPFTSILYVSVLSPIVFILSFIECCNWLWYIWYWLFLINQALAKLSLAPPHTQLVISSDIFSRGTLASHPHNLRCDLPLLEVGQLNDLTRAPHSRRKGQHPCSKISICLMHGYQAPGWWYRKYCGRRNHHFSGISVRGASTTDKGFPPLEWTRWNHPLE